SLVAQGGNVQPPFQYDPQKKYIAVRIGVGWIYIAYFYSDSGVGADLDMVFVTERILPRDPTGYFKATPPKVGKYLTAVAKGEAQVPDFKGPSTLIGDTVDPTKDIRFNMAGEVVGLSDDEAKRLIQTVINDVVDKSKEYKTSNGTFLQLFKFYDQRTMG